MTAINSNRAIRGPVTAVPVVAGKGVRLVADTENNRWVVEADETVLWEDANGASGSSGFPITLSETLSNFESVKFIWQVFNAQYRNIKETLCPATSTQFVLDGSTYNPGNTGCFTMVYCLSVSDTSLSFDIGRYYKWNGGTNPGEAAPFFSLYKVVGIHRIASN